MNFSITELCIYLITVLCVGSYATAFTIRWPKQQFALWEQEAHQILDIPFPSTLKDEPSRSRSRCPNCAHQLVWKDLIPVISYFLLMKKCRYCNNPISARYPITESLYLICCLPLVWFCNDMVQLILASFTICALLTAAIIDAEHKLIPDECNSIVIACALLNHMQLDTLNNSIFGMLVGYSLLYVLRWGYFELRKQEGLGLGDVKLVSALGAWLGISSLAPLLLCASLTGILYTVLSRRKSSEHLAFGPFLICTSITMYYYSKL